MKLSLKTLLSTGQFRRITPLYGRKIIFTREDISAKFHGAEEVEINNITKYLVFYYIKGGGSWWVELDDTRSVIITDNCITIV